MTVRSVSPTEVSAFQFDPNMMLTSNNGTTNSNSNNNNTTQVLDSLHSDFIHHVAFDIYGRRLATCAGDRMVRVWDLTETGDWTLVAQWSAHRSSVTHVSWAHPEFGNLLVTCGSDYEAKVWEERIASSSNNNNNNGSLLPSHTSFIGNNNLASRFVMKATLTDARRAVTCAAFSPRHWGLKLAIGAADGCVRLYEAVDIMNLAQWPLSATLQAFPNGAATTLCWCTGRFEPPTLVVGGSHCIIYRYIESARTWQSLIQLPDSGMVLDVAWAPNVGRRFHLIAAAEEQALKIYRLGREKLIVESVQTIPVNTWRCQWNVTGTVLASSGDGGVVNLYKADRDRVFHRVSYVQGDVAAAASDEMVVGE